MSDTYFGIPFDEIISKLYFLLARNTVNIAIISSLGYDIVYSLFDEVKYIWCGMRWSIPKTLYIIARYYCPLYMIIDSFIPPFFDVFGDISLNFCRAASWYDEMGTIIMFTAVDLIFAFRVSACYGNRKKIMWFLGISLAAEFSILFTSSILFIIAESKNLLEIPGLVCIVQQPENLNLLNLLQTAYYGVSLAVHSTMFLLTIIRFWKDIGVAQGGLRNMLQSRGGDFPIVTSFTHDGTLYFFIMFVFTVLQAWSTIDSRGALFDVYFNRLYFAMQSYTGSRLILNLRKMTDMDGSGSAPSMSRSIFFAHPAPGSATNCGDEEHEMDQV